MNENQFGVLLENILDKVNAIAEGQSLMEERFEKRFEEVEGSIMSLQKQVNRLETDIKVVKNFVLSTDEKLNKYERRIRGIKQKVAHL
jgi:septal ring factor EnvC (AmiA/AmiB activator)